MPLDHINLVVPHSKLEDLITFLKTSLAHLGFKEHMRPVENVVGLGDVTPYFWLSSCPDKEDSSADGVLKRTHVAFTAENVEQVKQFHETALKAGATCNGPPGQRAHYHPGYYGAFVHDPVCGMNVEVVLHTYEAK